MSQLCSPILPLGLLFVENLFLCNDMAQNVLKPI